MPDNRLSATPSSRFYTLPGGDGIANRVMLDDVSEEFDVWLFSDANDDEAQIFPNRFNVSVAGNVGGILVPYTGIGPFRGLRGWSAISGAPTEGSSLWVLATRRGQ